MFSKLYLFFFDLGRVLCAPLLLFFRVKKCGTNGARVKTADLPRGAVYVCNHVGFSDPMVLGCAFAPRRLFFWSQHRRQTPPCAAFCCAIAAAFPLTAPPAISMQFAAAPRFSKRAVRSAFSPRGICSTAARCKALSRAPLSLPRRRAYRSFLCIRMQGAAPGSAGGS